MIKATGLTKKIGHKTILANIDLQIPTGQFITVFGPNGAGKSTLLKILTLITKPSKGQVIVDGQDAAEQPAKIKKQIGVVSHQIFLNEKLTAKENLEFYGQMYNVPNLKNRIFEVINQVGLEFSINDPVRTYSRGMQQRLAIARAILHDPAILFLDEPYTGLDPHAIQILNKVLGQFNLNKRTVFMITHNFDEGLELGDRIAFLVNGRIVYDCKNTLSKEDLKSLYLRKVEGAA